MPFYTMPDQEKLYVREIGRGEPVLVLSGLGMQSWQWLPFIAANLTQHRFIIPDFRGFGGSKQCQIPQHLDAIASHWQDINCLLEQLSIKTIDVIGYSMGASTTLHGIKYGQFGERIKRYLHIDQSAKIRNGDDWLFGLFGRQQADALALLAQMIKLLESYQQLQQLAALPKNIQIQLKLIWVNFMQLQQKNAKFGKLLAQLPHHQLIMKILPFQSIAYTLWYLKSYFEHDEDYRDALTSLTCPTHFIIGKHSTLYPYQGQLWLAEQLEHAEIHVMQKSGHAPLLTQPVAFSKHLSQFLQA